MYLSNSGNNRTGWKSARYDELVKQANMQTDKTRRAELFRQAEAILITEEAPIVPVYFYAGFNYFDPQKIDGIYQNVLDEHPMQFIRKGSKMMNRKSGGPRVGNSPVPPVDPSH